ncbi:hypothetical protein MRX96_002894 [Rhipicephalus microplus]
MRLAWPTDAGVLSTPKAASSRPQDGHKMATMSVAGQDITQQEYENKAGCRLVNGRGRANEETTTHEAKD